MHHQPRVTVIISCYNHAQYIEACIRSVLEQSYPNIELLVYDDGSRDDSVAVIRKLADEFGFFFQPQANQGLANTLNAALQRASGELVAPFGSDDIMFPDRLQKQVPWMLARPDIGIAAGNVIRIDGDGRPLPAKKQRHHPERTLNFDDMFENKKIGPMAPTLLFRKEALVQIGGFNPAIRLEDLYIELKITEAGWNIGIMEDTLAYYRVHRSNTVKDLHFMYEAVMRTYACFDQHPAYERVKCEWLNGQFLKASDRDKTHARQCLQELPLHRWNLKTLRGLWRLWFAPERRELNVKSKAT